MSGFRCGMMVLVDTSVWVDHFRKGNKGLVRLLERDLVLFHQMIILEMACGTLPAPRNRTLDAIGFLQCCNQASLSEVLAFVEREKLYGLGCGLVDMALLASTLLTPGAHLWTLDKRLAALATRFGVAYPDGRHG